ncbi:hypothetical protein BBJ28_00005522 [Nothophytophthora sp. Chile5]|nr:hypothetical protein BBJ28_00005522 [Nothophytophthora sp. Chile5]
MRASPSTPARDSALRRLFSGRRRRRRRGGSNAASRDAAAFACAEQQTQQRRTRLLDSWNTPELFALRELAHMAINQEPIAPAVGLAASSAPRGDEPPRGGASSSASSSTAATTTPPASARADGAKRHRELQRRVDAALTRSRRFYFPRRADTRLRLRGRRQFVRLFPLLGRTSRTTQRLLFRAFDRDDSGKIEFDELCESLAYVRRARSASPRAMAELVFDWFQDERREGDAVLSLADVKLLAVTATELGGEQKQQQGHDLVKALSKLLLGSDQTEVTRQAFAEKLDCELGAHVLHVLLAPFDVVRALLEEESVLQEAQSTRWKAGDTAYVVASGWWTQWRQYVQPSSPRKQQTQTTTNATTQQGAGEQQKPRGDQQDGRRRCYSRPGPIVNSVVCENEQLGTLRPGLKEGEDFVLVPTGVWRRLVQVYGGGPEFPRQIVGAEQVAMDAGEQNEEEAKPAGVALLLTVSDKQQQRIQVELYPVALQIRLARHDSRRVYLVYARRFLLRRDASIKEIMQRMGVFPGVNAREVTLWVRRQRLKSWTRLEGSLDGPRATLKGLRITSSHELLVDFRALDIDEDPQSVAQQRRRSSLAAISPRPPFEVAMLQPVGNDFVCCPSRSLKKFAQTGDWKLLKESTAAEQDAVDAGAAQIHGGGVLTGLAKHMEMSTRDTSRGRLVAHNGLRATGLINMGNTCFMNSALQCFGHSPVFREYFLAHRFQDEVNKKNRLGSRGAVAAAYAQLQAALWREREQGFLLPGRFRDEFTRVRSHFQETRQYDAHEFMVALLDCLHEDLNQGGRFSAPRGEEDVIQAQSAKCLGFGSFIGGAGKVEEPSPTHQEPAGPPSDEVLGDAAWRAHTRVNSSVVVDLFHGQMRSETVCGTCGERKCTFDPTLFFSLPIPEAKFVRIDVSVVLQARKLPTGEISVDAPETAAQTVQRGFWLRRGSSVGVLCDQVAAAHGRAGGNRFLFVEVRRNRIKRVIEGDEVVDKLAAASTGTLYAYERAWTLAEIPTVPASLVERFANTRQRRGSASGKVDANAAAREKIKSFADLRVGSRVDARDNHNDWHPGTVIEVTGASDPLPPDLQKSADSAVDTKKRTPRVCVHFDAFSGKWNKWFTARDWLAQRLLPLHTRTSSATEVFEVQVVHRFATRTSSVSGAGGAATQPSGDDPHSFTGELPTATKSSIAGARERLTLDVFGTPLFVTIASDKTSRDMHQAILLQTARFWRGCDASKVDADDLKRNGDRVNGNDHASDNGSDVPYSARIVNLEDLGSARGEPLPFDSSALLQHFSTRSVLALDWTDYREYTSDEHLAFDDVPADVVVAAKTDPDLRADLDATAAAVELSRKNPRDSASAANDDDGPPMYAVSLAKCMDALLRDEVISLEDRWVCERCGVPREGARRSAIWRLPDLVMVQLKRFQYLENQHKQKVRALVDFPLKGLDFSRWMGHQEEGDASVYDLYAVANHVGGLTRGHYTAYCRYDTDLPESAALFTPTERGGDVQCPELWFRFDDEKVAEIAAGDVITDAAYVLFYKRRTLSPHNVLQYAL